MDGILVNNFDVASIERVYENVKGSIEINSMRGVVVVIAAVLIIDRLIKEYKNSANQNNGKPDMKDFTNLIYLYGFVMTIILILPFLLNAIEGLLGNMQQSLTQKMGTGTSFMMEESAKLFVEKVKNNPEGPSLTDGLASIADYTMTVLVAPPIYWATKYMYSLFIVGRYFYLIMLEIVSPVAIIMLLNERTHQYFMTWAKHMFICYLMIPCYLLANQFSDTLINTMFNNEVTIWFALLSSFLIKLSLFKIVNSKLYNLI